MSTEKDPYMDRSDEEVEETINRVKEAKNLGEVFSIIQKVYPKWIIKTYKRYSDDYPTLTSNWHEICKNMNVEPTCIIKVESFQINEKYKLISFFCELFTKAGFCVRTKNDIFGCYKCDDVLPQSHLHDLLKTQNKTVPKYWSVVCKKCDA
jgi:hypothetical protein